MEQLIFATIIGLFGIAIGSFLNVCIARIPDKKNIALERSHCMTCGNVLKYYELVPVFSYLVQGGKCRNCKSKISIQYPLVEIINSITWIAVYLCWGLTIETILFSLASSILIVITVIDWKTYEIPIVCNIAIMILGIIRICLQPAHWKEFVLGFFVVSVFLYIVYIVTKGRGIGGGDVKLMAVAGLLVGWQNIILALTIGCMLGSIIHLMRMKLQGEDSVLAFGPYLAAGIFISMLFGEPIIAWYIGYFWLP